MIGIGGGVVVVYVGELFRLVLNLDLINYLNVPADYFSFTSLGF